MLAAAWFWISVLTFVVGIGIVSRGFFLMGEDGRLGLRFVSFGSAIVVIALATTFLRS